MLTHRFLGLLASFCLFASFILELFVMIGQLSNKAFLNILYFVQANNPRYNLSYGFGLWQEIKKKKKTNKLVTKIYRPVAAYDWAKTPGFDQMLPGYASSKNTSRVFLALFILYFIGLIISFLLWLTTLPFALCCCLRRCRRGGLSRPMDITMATLTFINFFIMLTAMIISIILVVTSVKAVSNASIYWSGHAGTSLWFTIGSVVALFLAAICYLFKSCLLVDDANFGRVDSITENDHAYKNKAFDLTPHQPVTFTPMMSNAAPYQPNQQMYVNNHLQPHTTTAAVGTSAGAINQQEPYSISSLSQQYSPGLQPQYLSHIYAGEQQPPSNQQ